MRNPHLIHRSRHDGFATLIVLACMAVMAATLTAYSRSVLTNVRFSNYAWRNSRDFGLATAFGNAAMNAITRNQTATFWGQQPQFGCNLNGLEIWMSFRNHKGMVDINSANEQLIADGLVAVGLSVAQSKETASQFVQVRATGAHDAKSLLISDKLPKGPYQHGSAISLIEPVGSIEYWKVSDIFTAYNRSQGSSRKLASPLLQAVSSGLTDGPVGQSMLSPYYTFRIAFGRSGKIVDSWIFEYEASEKQQITVATISGDVFQQELPMAKRPCKEIIAANVIDAAREVLQ